MDSSMTIRLLGIGAAWISIDKRNIFFDAFNDYNAAPKLNPKDIIIFSHDDGDHFSAKILLSSVLPTNTIIGPPSISYPLLTSGKINAEQLHVPYPQEMQKPAILNIGDISISIFNVEHFVNWRPVHVSFLIKYGNKSVYLSGDSYLPPSLKEHLAGLDCIVYNLVKEEVVKNIISKKEGLYHHLSELLQVRHDFKPKLIIGSHLLNCDWTVDAKELDRLIKQAEIGNVVIPQSESDAIDI
jgi:L-ascorbate metabolism protein UlaG (beta-lactamase superfamily)